MHPRAGGCPFLLDSSIQRDFRRGSFAELKPVVSGATALPGVSIRKVAMTAAGRAGASTLRSVGHIWTIVPAAGSGPREKPVPTLGLGRGRSRSSGCWHGCHGEKIVLLRASRIQLRRRRASSSASSLACRANSSISALVQISIAEMETSRDPSFDFPTRMSFKR